MSDPGPIGRIQKRSAAISVLKNLSNDAARCLVIHYSCESFEGEGAKRSSRITSIAVRKLDSAQTRSFSISQIAEVRKIAEGQIQAHYDELEKAMLDEYFDYVKRNESSKWIHWNMRDANYGFPAIEHRYRVLGGTPQSIPDTNLFDLARLLVDKYSPSYMKHPRFANLMEKNGITKLAFLTGVEEADAFDKQEFWKLHRSTLRKVDNIANIFTQAVADNLEHNATRSQIYGLSMQSLVGLIKDHWIVTLFVVLAPVLTVIIRFTELWPKLRGSIGK